MIMGLELSNCSQHYLAGGSKILGDRWPGCCGPVFNYLSDVKKTVAKFGRFFLHKNQ